MATAHKTSPAKPTGKLIQTRKSGIHGNGVFAVQDIPKGTELIEYTGERISWKEALRRHPHDPSDPNHTFYFSLEDGSCIDALHGGNSSRWINHACKPNCEADEIEEGPRAGRVFIKAIKAIKAGAELFYDYGLVIDAPYTAKLKAEYKCLCGAKTCRGTMLAPKEDGERGDQKGKKTKSKKTKSKKSKK